MPANVWRLAVMTCGPRLQVARCVAGASVTWVRVADEGGSGIGAESRRRGYEITWHRQSSRLVFFFRIFFLAALLELCVPGP